jgi:hypothetical protein
MTFDRAGEPGRAGGEAGSDAGAEAGTVAGAAGLTPVATIHGTVDLERALAEHGHSPAEAGAAVRDPHLGANVVAIETPDGGRLALAEPIAEGRLAASLAHHGEGPLGRYVAVAEGDDVETYRRRSIDAGMAVSRIEAGPFGKSILVLVQPVTGPHLIVVEQRSLPSPR